MVMALESNKRKEYVPLLQPIFSVEEQTVVAYESLGRVREANGTLGNVPEFSDPHVTPLRMSVIDRELLGLSLQKIKNSNDQLFVNMSPDQVILEYEESKGNLLPIAEIVKHYGVPIERIVVEITEKSGSFGTDVLAAGVELLREQGFGIALDDVGSESSNLERLGAIKPDIIKIDLNILKKSIEKREYQSILEYLKQISLSIGSQLLFEGIESEGELYQAVSSGASLLQGYFLGRPVEFSEEKQNICDVVVPHLQIYHENKRKEVAKEIEFEKMIKTKLMSLPLKTIKLDNRVIIDPQSFFKLDPLIQRVYVTDWQGTQVSPYYERTNNSGFAENMAFLQKNWSYMPFFYKHVKQVFRDSENWQVSDPYWDKSLKKKVIVFSRVNELGYSFFVDLVLDETK
ncbi:EAL domain-containing protein [Leptospira biflexa]|uniref:EAL domain-containing protein n=1 Tax=Leptospira biflexa TaxID=172 RepID=UPI001082D067|nr:EAL domain-containing protein [Leptospira biflexa]TGM37590.1 EAL domain-containing protein [Leptospira biflexa]TGM40925.1 EAL domain-containing protein [Leptospira biflexa]TGM55677.1 EAL domain-containing protein [Leptospira biflexa]